MFKCLCLKIYLGTYIFKKKLIILIILPIGVPTKNVMVSTHLIYLPTQMFNINYKEKSKHFHQRYINIICIKDHSLSMFIFFISLEMQLFKTKVWKNLLFLRKKLGWSCLVNYVLYINYIFISISSVFFF